MFSLVEIEFWLYKLLFFIFSKLFLFIFFIFSNPIIFVSICLILVFLVAYKRRLGFSAFKRDLFFSLMMFIFLLLFLEIILVVGSFFYFHVYSNLGTAKIEEDSFRILFLGESTTAGMYPYQVEKILQQKYLNKKIKSYNKGIGAIKTTEILKNLNKNMIKYKPHLTILMAGHNDGFFSDEMNSGIKDLYSKFRIYRLIASIIETDAGGLVYNGKDYTLSKTLFNINSIIQGIHFYNSEIWLAGYLQPDAREKVNPVLKKIAKENNIIYIEDYPQVDFKINRSLFADDGWHPNEEGHKIIAEKIAEMIINGGIIDRWQPEV